MPLSAAVTTYPVSDLGQAACLTALLSRGPALTSSDCHTAPGWVVTLETTLESQQPGPSHSDYPPYVPMTVSPLQGPPQEVAGETPRCSEAPGCVQCPRADPASLLPTALLPLWPAAGRIQGRGWLGRWAVPPPTSLAAEAPGLALAAR